MTTEHGKRILLTGHRGYIGSVMAPYLVAQGHEVVGLDAGYFSECTLVPDRIEMPEVLKDIRDLVPADVRGFDAVVHLAALSNDPIGNLDEEWTEEINHRGIGSSCRARPRGRRPAVPLLLVLHHVRHVVGRGRSTRSRRSIRRPSTPARRSRAKQRSESSRTTAFRRRSCGTAQSTASRRGCGSTRCSTISSVGPSRPA